MPHITLIFFPIVVFPFLLSVEFFILVVVCGVKMRTDLGEEHVGKSLWLRAREVKKPATRAPQS